MIINGDSGYSLLAAYIGGPAAQAGWLGSKVGRHLAITWLFSYWHLYQVDNYPQLCLGQLSTCGLDIRVWPQLSLEMRTGSRTLETPRGNRQGMHVMMMMMFTSQL